MRLYSLLLFIYWKLLRFHDWYHEVLNFFIFNLPGNIINYIVHVITIMEWYNWIRKYSEQSVNGILLISLMHGDISEQLNFKVIHRDLAQFEQQNLILNNSPAFLLLPYHINSLKSAILSIKQCKHYPVSFARKG